MDCTQDVQVVHAEGDTAFWEAARLLMGRARACGVDRRLARFLLGLSTTAPARSAVAWWEINLTRTPARKAYRSRPCVRVPVQDNGKNRCSVNSEAREKKRHASGQWQSRCQLTIPSASCTTCLGAALLFSAGVSGWCPQLEACRNYSTESSIVEPCKRR